MIITIISTTTTTTIAVVVVMMIPMRLTTITIVVVVRVTATATTVTAMATVEYCIVGSTTSFRRDGTTFVSSTVVTGSAAAAIAAASSRGGGGGSGRCRRGDHRNRTLQWFTPRVGFTTTGRRRCTTRRRGRLRLHGSGVMQWMLVLLMLVAFTSNEGYYT